MSENKKKKCSTLDHPNLQKGWGCCECNQYNSDYFPRCKSCDHKRCDKKVAEA